MLRLYLDCGGCKARRQSSGKQLADAALPGFCLTVRLDLSPQHELRHSAVLCCGERGLAALLPYASTILLAFPEIPSGIAPN